MKSGVFITCFTRSIYLSKLIDILREVKPPYVFIASDGPRENNKDDLKKIENCREKFNEIDWDCKVYKFYYEENLGILKNNYESLKKVFEVVDRVIMLEDDMLPSKSFFYFCDELLEKYKDDYRIQRICGGNFIGIREEVSSDYFFARCVYSGAGAIWKRTFENIDFSYEFTQDKYTLDLFNCLCDANYIKHFKKDILKERTSYEMGLDILSFEKYYRTNFYLQSQCNIFPKNNLVKNQGVSKESIHNGNNINIFPKRIKKLFLLECNEIDWPIKHPKYITCDLNYEKYIQKKINLFSFKHKMLYFLKRSILELRYNGLSSFYSRIKKRISLNLKKMTDKNG
ncbi:hypothetical protein [Longibaculum muris]|uniref:hypothetical protein n=1 Tax=Longibaculum muris TaxID=1796628 RepID=UPI00189D79B8|nr:hypothetical protein [Longibaculum muris]